MLTIGELAAYAGVTTRTVRHYHQVGLLPEPERDRSGYRTYDAQAVVALIRVRTLAEAGVPLARVQQLLTADDDEFAAAVAEVDRQLRAQVRELQEHRRRIARLAAGDSLALPPEVTDYLHRLREAGAPAAMVDGERDAWILIAARWPDRIPEFMADKVAQLDDPRTVQLYRLIGQLIESSAEDASGGSEGMDDGRLARVADLIVELAEQSDERGELAQQERILDDDSFIALLDSYASDSHPLVVRLQELMVERGWQGWSRIERADRAR